MITMRQTRFAGRGHMETRAVPELPPIENACLSGSARTGRA